MAARLFFMWNMLTTAKRRDDEHETLRKSRARARASFDPQILSDIEFEHRYRLSKAEFKQLCLELRRKTDLKSSQRVSLEEKVLTALFFYASGSYQRPVGVAKHFSQKMCSVYIEQVTAALNHPRILNKYIQFPNTVAARQIVSQKFYGKYGIPGVVGCIDGSHFHIFKPHRDEEHLYYCRKHFHSMNVQMICDGEGKILSVNAKFGGSCHDSFVWENSQINSYMQSLHQNGETVWLLGDSGYPQRPWLMTPYQNPSDMTEQIYNDKHMKARVIIENCFGRLKNKWRCLCKDRVLHYKPLKCARIIQACCVLYNMQNAADMNELYDINMDTNNDEDIYSEVGPTASTDLLRGRVLRNQLARRL